MADKPFVFDLPLVKIQKFRVTMPNTKGRYFVERKEITRQQHNMGCTDGMKEGEVSVSVKYSMTQEVDPIVEQEIIKIIEKEIGDD